MLKLLKYLVIKNVLSPLYLIHFVTNKCNARCPHCFLAQGLNAGSEDELSIEEIEKITKNFSKDIYNVNLTGGEPFIRDDISQIVGLYRKNANVKSFLIATNGYFSDKIKDAVKTIIGENNDIFLTVSLSLDHIGAKFDELRSLSGLYDKVIFLYRELSRFNTKRLSVQVNLTIQKDNYKELEYILNHLVFKEKIKNMSLSMVRGDSNNKMSNAINHQDYLKINKLFNSYCAQGHIKGFENGLFAVLNAKNQISRQMIAKTLRDNKFISACYAGALTGVLYPNGDVYPCELHKSKFGNIRDFNYDFKTLWSCKKAQQTREEIIKSRCFCTHECNWTTNILFNIKFFPGLLARTLSNSMK